MSKTVAELQALLEAKDVEFQKVEAAFLTLKDVLTKYKTELHNLTEVSDGYNVALERYREENAAYGAIFTKFKMLLKSELADIDKFRAIRNIIDEVNV